MRNARVKIQLTKTDSFRRPSCLALLRPMGVAPIYAREPPTLAAVVALDAPDRGFPGVRAGVPERGPGM